MIHEDHIILFDGVCNLCNSAVRYVYKRDKKGIFTYLSLQSEKGKQLLKEMGYDDLDLKSFIYIKNNQVFTKSSASLQVSKSLGFPYSILSGFLIVPKIIRDKVYDIIAANRYKWFGKQDEVCEFDPSFQQKVL